MNDFDFVIAGGGLAGLSLAHHLHHSALRDRALLIVDKDDDDQLSRNYGYWADHTTVFDHATHYAWDKLAIVSDGRAQGCAQPCAQIIDLGAYEYKLVRGSEFYASTLEELRASPNVTFVRGLVDCIEDGADRAWVWQGGQRYSGRWVFDSLLSRTDAARLMGDSPTVKMQFKGWDIRTPAPVFDDSAAVMFDFRVPQRDASGQAEMRFFYVMPFAPNFALVEMVAFSPRIAKQSEFEDGLREHIQHTRGVGEYEVLDEENGCVPLVNGRFRRRVGHRVMTIGTKAGMLKVSTGYSLMRVQRDCERIVRSLERRGHPFDVPSPNRLFRWMDTVMLRVMAREPEAMKPTFTAMFQRIPIQRIFRFLDEDISLADLLRLIAHMPKAPFIRAAFPIPHSQLPTRHDFS